MMITASARTLAGERVCFVGVGLPNIVCNLAQRTVSPELQLVYEAGVFGARPERLPLSIGDPTLVSGCTPLTSMFELFAYYLQAGLIDVAFLGGAQIDRFGNLNTTVIGSFPATQRRVPGGAGGPGRRRRPRVARERTDELRDGPWHLRVRRGHRRDDAPDDASRRHDRRRP